MKTFNFFILLLITCFLGSLNAMAAEVCNPEKLSVPADQNIQFQLIFHHGFADEIEVDRGPKTELITKSYKVGSFEKAQRVQEEITLPSEFDLSQGDEATLASLKFAVDERGGSDPGDHTPTFVSVDRKNRTLTVAVDLENEKVQSENVQWKFQIAQVQKETKSVEPYPVEIASEQTRTLDAMEGAFDQSLIHYSKLNAAPYLSIRHKESSCLVKSYEYSDGEYREIGEINSPVEIVGKQMETTITMELQPQKQDSPIQGALKPVLKTAE